MTRSRASSTTLPASLFLALLVAACGQGPAATSLPAATSGPATAPAGTGGGPRTTSEAPRIDACALLKDEDIASITGIPVAARDPDPVNTAYPIACEWRFQGANWVLTIGVLSTGGSAFLDLTVDMEGGTPIPGLGDRAVRTEVSDAILVLVGDTLLDLQLVAVGEPSDAAVRLTELAVSALRP